MILKYCKMQLRRLEYYKFSLEELKKYSATQKWENTLNGVIAKRPEAPLPNDYVHKDSKGKFEQRGIPFDCTQNLPNLIKNNPSDFVEIDPNGNIVQKGTPQGATQAKLGTAASDALGAALRATHDLDVANSERKNAPPSSRPAAEAKYQKLLKESKDRAAQAGAALKAADDYRKEHPSSSDII